MTIYEIVEKKLQDFPAFRERKDRAKFLSILALRDLGLEAKQKTEPLTLEELAEFSIKFSSYDRAWRDCLYHNKSLQGTDYLNKEELVQEKLLELGYEPQIKLNI